MPDVPVEPVPVIAAPAPTLLDKITLAIGEIVVLRATTVVGVVTAIGADKLNQVTGLTLSPDNQQVASTSFNTLLGDGSVIAAPIFVTDPAYKALHEKTVADALDIREKSVALLKDLWATFGPLLDKKSP